MERNSTTLILICLILFITTICIFFLVKIISPGSNIEYNQTLQNPSEQPNTVSKFYLSHTTNESSLKSQNLSRQASGAGFKNYMNIAIIVIFIVGIIIPVFSFWKIYSDNGEKGFSVIIPIYSQMILYRIAGLKETYVLFIFIPLVGTLLNYLMTLYAIYLLGQKYHKNILFILGLIFLPFIFLPILAFSKPPKKFDFFYDN